MSVISTAAGDKLFRLDRWGGLNQSPDGDTVPEMGQASLMRNFRITPQGHLQLRPGYETKLTLGENSPVRGLWHGYVDGREVFLAACAGHLWVIRTQDWTAQCVGDMEDAPTSFFGFEGKVYLLTGREYYVWNGTDPAAPVEGYIPIVTTAAPPAGGGVLLERVNLLTGKRRGRFSPDGQATVFVLPETGVDEVISVEGTHIPWTADTAAGTVVFESPPEEGINTLEITWRHGTGERSRVAGMRWAELYNGSADTRVFLYGDGTNRTVYSGLDEFGRPTAEYFPELNEIAVDSANTPITAMVRHYDRLAAYKRDSAHLIEYGAYTLDTGEVTAGFTCLSVNRAIGCDTPGQVCLVRNNPRTLFQKGVYDWALSGSGTRDERNAKKISDRVYSTLESFLPAGCVTFDDESRQEFYICHGSEALIHSYALDVWFYYDRFPARHLVSVDGQVYFATEDGKIAHLSREYRSDDGEPIDACWESGSMDFGQEWTRKHACELWISMKPERNARITVSALSDGGTDGSGKEAVCNTATLEQVDFSRFSFATGRRPRVARVKLKMRKFAYCKLIFSSRGTDTTATVLGVDCRVHFGGKVT